MSNPIKYSTGTESQALKKGNLFFGSGDVGKGPTSSTGYYNGYSPPSGGYMIYLYKSGAPGDLSYFSAGNDTQLISFTNNLANTSFTSATQCLNYFNTQTDKMVFNIDYPPIVTSGLVLSYDAGFVSSYSTSGTSWYDGGPSGKTQTLINGPTYSAGTIVFDGSDDYTNIPSINGPSLQTIELFFKANSTSYKTLFMGLPYYRPRISLRDNVVNVYYGMETGSGDIIFTFNSISTSQWYQLVYTYSGSTNHKCYLNTVEGTRSSNNSGLNGIPSFSSIQLAINAGSESWFNGQMSVLRLYDRVLSASEIQQNYEAIGTRYVTFNLQYMVVAGGGGGGSFKAGGGGAGGLLTGYTTSLSINTNYTITIGSGGALSTNGSNSVFHTITTIGGGAGGDYFGGTPGNGGSGGGAGGIHSSVGARTGGTGTGGQGNNGGNNWNLVNVLTNSGGAGGGGAGMSGYTSTETSGATGGDGLYFSEYTTIGGDPVGWFAGGGGGGGPYNDNRGFGGKGGGGQGAQNRSGFGSQNAYAGTINTGGGGGGASSGGSGAGFYDGKPGGSGIIILRVPDVYTANFSSGVSSSVTKSGGYKYYKITATSTTSETVSFS